jgi:DNA-binding GntR family transcriptional regulator
MNAGSIFERVYRSIKTELLRGAYRPGETLEPRALAEDHFASVTPIRDALHRLAGERLVDASPHEGFRVPLLTENGLRDLYAWQEQLALLALRQARSSQPVQPRPPATAVERTRHIFESLARLTLSGELQIATDQANDRLEAARHLELGLLPDLEDELAMLEQTLAAGTWQALRPLLARHRSRRLRLVPHLITALHQGPRS